MSQAEHSKPVLRRRFPTGVLFIEVPRGKGGEFRSACFMAFDDELTPLQGRIESVGDHTDFEEVYDSEHHSQNAACSIRKLLVTIVEPARELLDELARENSTK